MTDHQIKNIMQRVLHETQAMRSDITTIKQVQSDQGTDIKALRSDTKAVKTAVRHQGVLLEDLESRFTTVIEVYGS